MITEFDNISILYINLKVLFIRQFIKPLLQKLSIVVVFVKAKYCPFLEVNWLVHNLVEHSRVVESNDISLTLDTRRKNDVWSGQNFCFNRIRFEINLKIPFFDFLRSSNHFIKPLNAADSLHWLLKEALSDLHHEHIVLSNLIRNSNQDTELRW